MASLPRSSTGRHVLRPASRPGSTYEPIPRVPTYSLITWTFGRGSVIWRIWPAVLLHTLFSTVVTTLSVEGIVHLDLPNVMLTVLGVVIGFVISYRASSGYERYWMGRTYWSDIIRNSRTLGRLVWFHVPARLSPKTPEETQSGRVERSPQELNKVMSEKRIALDLIHGFSIAVKHHLRGELGIYYEDLYQLVRPLHDHVHTADDEAVQDVMSAEYPEPRKGMRITTQTALTQHEPTPERSHTESESQYGTFGPEEPHMLHRSPSARSFASKISDPGMRQPLLPPSQPPPDEVMNKVATDIMPFARLFALIKRAFSSNRIQLSDSNGQEIEQGVVDGRQWRGPVDSGMHMKHRPRVAGGGENLPLEIIRCLSEWFSVLEDRGTVPGTSMGTMVGTLAAFEDTLTGLERILTTPLPFTVWLYLFFLPFQLVSQFRYYAIPGVAMASFIYLGFVAAGEEMEQPFEIVGTDLKHLKQAPALNAYLGPLHNHPITVHRRSSTLDELTKVNGTPATSESPVQAPVDLEGTKAT
ncbi:Bestrophin, RFP-TM, chloride channel-domain-containing protein [Coprinopsis sp. MPI-PUGE-AT-0042]|nr:Bestrophin, RFP-TM, chloride channel-domain-containing protein [Coprinopsis sp. MPI-PUGE-AT-0042]